MPDNRSYNDSTGGPHSMTPEEARRRVDARRQAEARQREEEQRAKKKKTAIIAGVAGGVVLLVAIIAVVLALVLGGGNGNNEPVNGEIENMQIGANSDNVENAEEEELLEVDEATGTSKTVEHSDGTESQVLTAAPDAPTIDYPTAWLVADDGDVPAFTPVKLAYTPDIAIYGRRVGVILPDDQMDGIRSAWNFTYEDMAVVLYNGNLRIVNPENLLVNLPEVLNNNIYNIVYSYAATSRCAGKPIEGLTGQRVDGYSADKQDDAYLNYKEFIVPCAYKTAVKLAAVSKALEKQEYKLLVYDAYRPMRAQNALSSLFDAALKADPDMQSAISAWGRDWYVSPGVSGHNFGTDVDVGLCELGGQPLLMPSDFDAFDVSGTLTTSPMEASQITPDAYRPEVASNAACMALHTAFKEAGFSELASEWWHFADEETEAEMRAIVGDSGMDYVAQLSS